jgi:hypothetical protein
MKRRNDRSSLALAVAFSLLLAACGGNRQEQPVQAPLTVPAAAVAVARLEPVKKTVDKAGRVVLQVPSSSVVKNDGVEEVFVVGRDSVVSVRWISTGRSMDGNIVVLSGLDEGEVVVATKSPGLREGSRITTVMKDRAKEARAHE